MRFSRESKIHIGVDCTTISRIDRLLSDYPDQFRNFAFTSNEQQYCEQQPICGQHYAARWAVKEAFIKAIGIPEANPKFTSIEVVSEPVPQLSLTNEALELLSQKSLETDSSVENTNIDVTMSHEKESDLAVGIVMVVF